MDSAEDLDKIIQFIDGYLSTKNTISGITQPSAWTSTSIVIDNAEDLHKPIQLVLIDINQMQTIFTKGTVKQYLSHGECEVPITFFKAHGRLDEFHRETLEFPLKDSCNKMKYIWDTLAKISTQIKEKLKDTNKILQSNEPTLQPICRDILVEITKAER